MPLKLDDTTAEQFVSVCLVHGLTVQELPGFLCATDSLLHYTDRSSQHTCIFYPCCQTVAGLPIFRTIVAAT